MSKQQHNMKTLKILSEGPEFLVVPLSLTDVIKGPVPNGFMCIHKEQYELLCINVLAIYLQSFEKYAGIYM